MVHFVGAGPGAEDLITLRGAALLRRASVVVYAGSLVNPALLSLCGNGCSIYNSAEMTLEQVLSVLREAEAQGREAVRLHTGDPSLYGAIREQMDALDRMGIAYDLTPGVSSFCGAAASLRAEYTLPGLSQSLIITRMAGRTAVPEREGIAALASHGASMVVFLSAGMLESLQAELLRGAYTEETPAALVYKATWPEEKLLRCKLGALSETGRANGISKTTLVMVGDFLEKDYLRSRLYAPDFSTGYREAEKAQEKELGAGRDARREGQEAAFSKQTKSQAESAGRLFVVGMGPGGMEGMTQEARDALDRADVLCGYTAYLDLLRPFYPGKEYFSTPMRGEAERCRKALELCEGGRTVALACSGDAGVYGMAGLALELAEGREIEIAVLPGVTAALSGAAVLGAPLGHDFCVISLSDLLTPWERIAKRLRCAAEGDFALCLYNPASHKRRDHLRRACDLLLDAGKPPETVCGWVRNIGREGQESRILPLRELREERVDMFTTIFIGNAESKVLDGRMVTPRGYALS